MQRIFCLLLFVYAVSAPSLAESQQPAGMDVELGLVPAKQLPKPQLSDDLVILNVPHIKQKPGNCVPTSCAMILRFFDEYLPPGKLKSLAENHKPAANRNQTFTYWKDLSHALKSQNKNWHIESFPKTKKGFDDGLERIKKSLRDEVPVMTEVHLGEGHTFVVMGFDDARKLLYIRDPWISRNKIRVLSYDAMQKYWHNHKYSSSRSAFIPTRSGDDSKTEKP